MENSIEKEILTQEEKEGVYLSHKDAEEYKAYKKRKRLNEIALYIASSEASAMKDEDMQKVCETATRLKQASVKIPPTKLSQAQYYLMGGKVKVDCVVGGNGETLAKVKAYEARLAVRKKAKEITMIITPSFLDYCRYGEVRKEIKKVRRAIGKTPLKVRVETNVSLESLSRVARIARECGAKFFSIPYFLGCHILKVDLGSVCGLEVSGVEKITDFNKLKSFGVDRIVTGNAMQFYNEWMKEVEETSKTIAQNPVSDAKADNVSTVDKEEKPPLEVSQALGQTEINYS